jgi:U6 snRNA-associated Sm-like protein LSm6
MNNVIQSTNKKVPSPSEFLRQAVGRKVTVKLHNNYEYKGVLICLDGTMNVYLQQCEEYYEGEMKSRYADIFIRGNNGKL